MLPEARPLRKGKMKTIAFLGLNEKARPSDGEFISMKNISSEHFPYLAPSYPRTEQRALTTYSTVDVIDAPDIRIYIDGSNLKYYDIVEEEWVTIGSLGGYHPNTSMVYFEGISADGLTAHKKLLVFPQRKYVDLSVDQGDWSISNFDETCPHEITRAVVHKNRVWGITNDKTVHASVLGNPIIWNQITFGETAIDDSWTARISQGWAMISAIVFQGRPTIIMSDRIYQVYGDEPANFSIVEIADFGTYSIFGPAVHNNHLFIPTQDGVMIFDGTSARNISTDKLKTTPSGAGVVSGEKYYITHSNTLYVYDIKNRIWTSKDFTGTGGIARLITSIDSSALFALTNGASAQSVPPKLYRLEIESGISTIESEAITGRIYEEISNKKGYSKLHIRVELQASSTFKIEVSYDGGSYTTVVTQTTAGYKSIRQKLKLQRCDFFQLKISGTGRWKLHEIEREFIVRSDL